MTPVRRILCATDLSPASDPAWAEARLLGGLFDAEIVLLHVLSPIRVPTEGYLPPHLYQEWVEAGRRDAEAGLARLLAGTEAPAKARTRVEEGAAAEQILRVAADESADLVVMGTHGRTGLARLVFGSVADRVVRLAPIPVVTVRTWAPRPRIARILYATDFSPNARAVWPWVVTLAEAAGAAVDLLHVTLQPVPDAHLGPAEVGRMARLLHEEGEAAAQRFLRDAIPPPPADRVHVLIGRGVVGEQILHFARERESDLVVMGTHGWSGLVRWMLGSVALHVLQAAPCPVLTLGPGRAGEGTGPAETAPA